MGLIFRVRPDRCITCRACVGACPFGNMLWDAAARLAAKCDLCGGRPQCVKYCPTGAITYEPFDFRSLASRPAGCVEPATA